LLQLSCVAQSLQGTVIRVYRLAGPTSVPRGPPPALLLENQDDAQVINQIRTGHVNGRPALLSVDDGGHVHLFMIDAVRRGTLAPHVSFLNEEATWGLALCASRPLIAVSANNWRVSVWDLERTVLRRGRLVLQGHSVRHSHQSM
jgi:hypothetical protein